MTHEEWVKLTPEQQRIKVAKLAGWADEGQGMWKDPDGIYCQALYPTGGDGNTLVGLGKHDEDVPPNYLNDLNAMHDCMIMIRDRGLFANYYANLRTLHGVWGLCFSTWQEHNCTAAQRAEAFVVTMEAQ